MDWIFYSLDSLLVNFYLKQHINFNYYLVFSINSLNEFSADKIKFKYGHNKLYEQIICDSQYLSLKNVKANVVEQCFSTAGTRTET